jgi:WD40 repeat protein
VAIAFSPDGKRLAVGLQDGRIQIHDLKDAGGATITLESKEPFYSVATLAFSPDGNYLAMAWTRVVVWDVRRAEVVATLRVPYGRIGAVGFSPDGCLLAAAGWDRAAHIWNLETRKAVSVFQARSADPDGTHLVEAKLPLVTLAFSPDGKRLATAGADRVIWIWDVASGILKNTLRGHTMTITSLGFTPDNRLLISGSLDGTIRLWDSAGNDVRTTPK